MKFQLSVFGYQYKKYYSYPPSIVWQLTSWLTLDFAPVNYVRRTVSFLALIMITLICRHELITFVVNVFSSYKSDIVVVVKYFKHQHTLVDFSFIFSDWWSISWSPDSEHYNLTHVYGESFTGAIYNVQCSRIKFSQPSWRMVNMDYEVFAFILKDMNFSNTVTLGWFKIFFKG